MAGKSRRQVLFARRLAAASIALGLVAAGCGDGGETAKGGEAKAQFSDYCAKSLAIETYPEPDFSNFDSLPPEQQSQVVKTFTSQLLPIGEQVVAAAPPELKTDGNLLLDVARKASQTGDPSGFDEPTFKAAEGRLHAFDLANCGWASADVTAKDYSFSGVPESVEPGPLSIQLANEGKDIHDLTVFRINDGVTDSVKDIIALPQEEGMKKVTMMGATFAEPGGSDYKVFKLEKGSYGVACFVPLGEKHDGPPHASKGMYASFTVK
ncbi:MAG: hypothetical protein ACR2KK_01730 [Acidimicrobiales bacterium]